MPPLTSAGRPWAHDLPLPALEFPPVKPPVGMGYSPGCCLGAGRRRERAGGLKPRGRTARGEVGRVRASGRAAGSLAGRQPLRPCEPVSAELRSSEKAEAGSEPHSKLVAELGPEHTCLAPRPVDKNGEVTASLWTVAKTHVSDRPAQLCRDGPSPEHVSPPTRCPLSRCSFPPGAASVS